MSSSTAARVDSNPTRSRHFPPKPIWTKVLSCLFVCLLANFATAQVPESTLSPSESIEAKLDGTATVSYIDQPLKKILADLSAKHEIKMRIEESAFESAPDSPDLSTSILLKNVSLRSALRLMLREHSLDFILRRGELVVTSSKVAKSALQDRQYTLPADIAADAEPLLAAMEETILSHHPSATASIDGAVLTVDAPSNVLVLVEQLLFQLQQPNPSNPRPEEALAVKLRQQLDLRFIFTELPDVVRHVSEQTNLPIVIDRTAFKDAGLDLETPVTFELAGVPLDKSLRFLLHQYDMDYIINEVIIVVPKKQADAIKQVRIHRMPPAAQPHMGKLRDLLLNAAPQVWAATDTQNRVAILGNALIVYGNEETQQGTAAFVDSMKARFQAFEARATK